MAIASTIANIAIKNKIKPTNHSPYAKLYKLSQKITNGSNIIITIPNTANSFYGIEKYTYLTIFLINCNINLPSYIKYFNHLRCGK